jgi:hypothetical protein
MIRSCSARRAMNADRPTAPRIERVPRRSVKTIVPNRLPAASAEVPFIRPSSHSKVVLGHAVDLVENQAVRCPVDGGQRVAGGALARQNASP